MTSEAKRPKMFAKLFGPENDQVLVKIDRGENDDPEVRIFFTIPAADEVGVCSVAVIYSDNDEGWDNAEKAFAMIDEAHARKLATEAADVYLGKSGTK